MFILLLAVVLWKMASTGGPNTRPEEIIYSDFMTQVEQGKILSVIVTVSPVSADVEGDFREPNKKFHLTVAKESLSDLSKLLREKGVRINIKQETRSDWLTFILNALPFFLLVDAVLHSGVTLDFWAKRLLDSRPKSLRTAVLIDKPKDRKVDFQPDYFCFQSASNYLVGYGLPERRGMYRNLPFVGELSGAQRGGKKRTGARTKKSRGKKRSVR